MGIVMADDARDRCIDELINTVNELREITKRQQAVLDKLQERSPVVGSETDSTREMAPPTISRSRLLKTVTASGLGLVMVGALAPSIASAETERSQEVTPSVRVTGPAPKTGIGVDASSGGFAIGVFGSSKKGTGVHGETHGSKGAGVSGKNTTGGNGVYGFSASGYGVHGHTSGYGAGVAGTTVHGTAVFGLSSGTGTAVAGSSQGSGVSSESLGGYDGVKGSTSGHSGGAGVHGSCGSGPGVVGESASDYGVKGTGGSGGVRGESTGSIGVAGQDSGGGYGVYGTSYSGVGGYFYSEVGAPLWLSNVGTTLPAVAFGGQFWVAADDGLWYYKGNKWVQLI
jgi:hypothetical protein